MFVVDDENEGEHSLKIKAANAIASTISMPSTSLESSPGHKEIIITAIIFFIISHNNNKRSALEIRAPKGQTFHQLAKGTWIPIKED